jgi:isorenieratene synthase
MTSTRVTHFAGPVVVGGGVAGLSAALSLSEAGLGPLLVERDAASLGGRVSAKPDITFHHGGRDWRFTSEHGIHGWWTPYLNFRDLLARYGLADELVPAVDQTLAYLQSDAVHRIHVGRKTQDNRLPEPLHHLPLLADPRFAFRLKAHELLHLPRVGGRVLETLRLDPADPAHRAHYDQLSAGDYARQLPEVFRHFMYCLTRSGFFADPDDVSLLAFLSSLQFYVFLRRDNQRFSFARGQIRATMLDPLAAALTRQGGHVAQGIRIERAIRQSDGGWHLVWKREGPPTQASPLRGKTGVLAAPSLILALDMEAAKALCATSPDLQAAYGDLSSLRGRPSAAVRHFWPGQPRDTAPCGVLGGEGLHADAFFWLDQFQPEFAAWRTATGGSVSECHVYDLGLLAHSTDAQLMDGVQENLRRVFPDLGRAPVHSAIVRNPPTNSAFAPGSDRVLPGVVTPDANLALAGDWIVSGSLSFFMERACHTGLLAANQIRTFHNQPPRQTFAFQPPPPHVQGLQRLLRRFPPILAMVKGP